MITISSNITSKVYLLLISMLIVNLLEAQEKGKPIIRNYSSKEYNAHSQNWAITQDQRGVMYFGNGDGVLEFDGVRWRLIPLPEKPGVRSLGITKKGVVLVGARNEFGYLEPNQEGELKYNSLAHLVPENHKEFLEIWHIFTLDNNEIYFVSNNKIFLWSDNKIKVFDCENDITFSFYIKNQFYFNDLKVGLKKIVADSVLFLKNGEITANMGSRYGLRLGANIAVPLNSNQVLLVPTNNENIKLLELNPQSNSNDLVFLNNYNTEARNFSIGNHLYTNIKLSNSQVFLGSTEKGGVIIDQSTGEIIQQISKENGLALDIIYSSFEDDANDLWLGLGNGLSLVKASSNISYWDQKSNLFGPVEAINRFRGTLYIATHKGLFYIEGNTIKRLNKHKNMCWSLLVFKPNGIQEDEKLLVGSSGTKSIYEIKDNNIINLNIKGYPESATFELAQSKYNRNRIYAGMTHGFATIKYENGKYLLEDNFPSITKDVRSIAEDSDGNIWLGTYRDGVVKISPSETPKKQKKITFYKKDKGLPSLKNVLVYPFKNSVVFGTEFGLMKYDKETDYFVPDDRLGKRFSDGSKDVFSFIESKNGDVWTSGLFNKTGPIGVNYINNKGKYTRNENPFKGIPEMMVLAFYVEPNGVAWIGGSEGLFKYDPVKEEKERKQKPALIRKVIVGNDSTLFDGTNFENKDGKIKLSLNQYNQKEPTLDYDNNSIIFHYAFPSFMKSENNQYQYYLEGYDKGWSKPENKTYKEYTNLFEGNYSFNVMATNIYNEKSSVATFKFRIAPPFYRTTLVYIFYVFGLIISVYGIIKYNTFRLKTKNKFLEITVQRRTADIQRKNLKLEQQKKEIETQKNELINKSEKIEQAYNNIELLNRIGKKVTSQLSLKNIVGVLYENINSIMHAPEFGVGIYEKKNQHVLYKYYFYNDKIINEYSIPITDKNRLAAHCITNKKEIFLGNIYKEYHKYIENLDSYKESELLKSMICLPLISKNEIFGIISVQSFNENAYSEYHLNVLRNLSVYVSIALENSNAYNKLDIALKDFKASQSQLIESEKMASLGTLTAGIAHEINNPINFISSGARSIRANFEEFKGYLNKLKQEDANVIAPDLSQIESLNDANELEYLFTETQELLDGILDGSKRTSDIVKSLRTFSRLDENEVKPISIHKSINAVLVILNKEHKNRITISKNYGNIPKVECYPAKINQVFLNVLINAIEAIHDSGKINITTTVSNRNFNDKLKEFVRISIKDNGIGMSEKVKDKIFEPFFTTKEVGKGSGLGLSISYGIIKDHKGDIEVKTKENTGTELILSIPVFYQNNKGNDHT